MTEDVVISEDEEAMKTPPLSVEENERLNALYKEDRSVHRFDYAAEKMPPEGFQGA